MTWDEDNKVILDEIKTVYDDSGPYLLHRITQISLVRSYNPQYGDDIKCVCGHNYYRHFDTWENMDPVGCKYCHCYAFVPVQTILKEI